MHLFPAGPVQPQGGAVPAAEGREDVTFEDVYADCGVKFNKSYQKQFYLYCLKAMQATFNNDSILSKEYYGKTIGLLQNQVNLEYDETAFYELYLMKSKINPCALVEKELDSIINEDGQYREIANILRSSLSHLSSLEGFSSSSISSRPDFSADIIRHL